MMRRNISLIAACCLGLSVEIAGACPLELPQVRLDLSGHPLDAEIADTAQARACGLSRRDALAADHGMLFVFHGPVRAAFWMKDTRIPLSIAFLDAEGRVLTLMDMQPDDGKRRYAPEHPYHAALEMPLGWFQQHGIGPGARLHGTVLP